ncbi:MAG: hypothetical protein MUE44_06465 [Oscillatoriaceae cyanobacterium Prado104]|jgi:hypothetical protein|nr:hypothetical protein [Oscillatoriaceae cyanobacterium Prado104]
MSGYFSQLIGQTGIVLPQQNVLTQNVVSDIFSLESAAEEMPIQEEHLEVMVSQPEQPVSPAVQANKQVRENDRSTTSQSRSDPPEIISASQTVQSVRTPIVPETSEQSAIANSEVPEIASVSQSQTVQQAHSPVMPEAGESSTMANSSIIAGALNRQPTILETIEEQSFSETIPISHPSESKEAKNSSKNTENTVSESIESVQVESESAGTESTINTVKPTPNAREYLQAIRDWVAGTPRQIEEIQEISDRQMPGAIEQNAKPAAAPPLALESSSQQEVQPPQEQDFVLSIGSINLTIETPQPETLTQPVLRSQNSPKIEPDFAASRLSRYYLRLK